jgi:hypothetical protein
MKFNHTNRRRALQRRRKLMPEPRRISANEQTTSNDTEVLREVPIGPVRPPMNAGNPDAERSPDAETVVALT